MASDKNGESRPWLFRSILQGTVLYSVAVFAQRTASIILLPVNTRFLTPADYGVLELLEQLGIVIALLFGFNVTGALGYFYFQDHSPQWRRKVVSTTIVGATLVGVAACAFGIASSHTIGPLFFGRLPYHLYLIIVFASFPLSFPLEAELGWLRVANHPSTFSMISLLRVGVTVVGVVFLVAVCKLRTLGVLLGGYTAMAAAAIPLTVYCFRRVSFTFDLRLFLRVLSFSVPLGMSALAMFIINFGDRLILPHYRPLSELGIYGIAYKIGMLLSFLYSSFQTYWSSQIFDIARRDDADTVITRIFTYVVLALSFCALGLVVLSRPALGILTTPSFGYAAVLAPVIVLAYYIRAIGDFFRCLFIVHGHPAYDTACNWMGALACLGGYFFLIPRFGVWGAAIATAAAFLLIGTVSMIWTYRLKPYHLDGSRLLKIGVVTGTLTAMYFAVPFRSLPAQAAWSVCVLLAYPLLLWFLRFPRRGEVRTAWFLLHDVIRQGRVWQARSPAGDQ